MRDPAWEEALARVQAYLAARRLGDAEWARDCSREIIESARDGAVADGGEIEAALREAETFLNRFSGTDSPALDETLRPLFSGTRDGKFEQRDVKSMLAQVKTPVRPPETRPMRMQTSLSRLPSIRLIGGWIVLIALLFVIFVLTHR